MKPRNVVTLALLFALVTYRFLQSPMGCTLLYIGMSYALNYDADIVQTINTDGEIEGGVFMHRFIPLTETSSGDPVEVTYHVVECGDRHAEPLVFFHGLGENWGVWKKHMRDFCGSHYVVSVDTEGMGQSAWPHVLRDLPTSNSRAFMANMTVALLRKLNISKFNLVVTDYSFWSTLPLLSAYGDIVLRFGKFQSTVGVEDAKRIPQAKLFLYFPKLMSALFNSAPHALMRVVMGHPLPLSLPLMQGMQLPALLSNSRVGPRAPIAADVMTNVILKNIPKRPYEAWVYFYHYGLALPNQMDLQRNTFRDYKGNVLIFQGADDGGQPPALFDGTATLDLVEISELGFIEKFTLKNHTHRAVTTYSADGSVIGPTADQFFPNSPWVRMKMLSGVGHFAHLEAPEEVAVALKELLESSIPADRF